MRKYLIGVFIMMILVSCDNHYNGKEIKEGISICAEITQYRNGRCEYVFIGKWDYTRFYADCGKWQIGDTL
jgi:hypothetical protein